MVPGWRGPRDGTSCPGGGDPPAGRWSSSPMTRPSGLAGGSGPADGDEDGKAVSEHTVVGRPRRPGDAGTGDSVPWHALDAEMALAELDSGPHGLDAEEAERRLEAHGPNRLAEAAATPWWVTLLAQFTSPLIFILILAAALTFALGEHVDTAVIAAVLLLNASIGLYQERNAERSVLALMQLVSPTARVVRGGHEWEVDSAEVVPGDLVVLESGALVPADLRLVSAAALRIDESMLTGESVPASKGTDPVAEGATLGDRTCMAFTGSTVARGRARGVVVATGRATELGRISERLESAEVPATPLQERMDRFAWIIGAIVVVSAALTFLLGLAFGESASDVLLVAAALAVAAVPEGLPVVLTVALALGVRRMAKRNAIVRRLPAVETLGSTTLIGSDKTGTLTENRMTVQQISTPFGRQSLAEDRVPADPRDAEAVEVPTLRDDARALTLLAGVLANEGEITFAETGIERRGDPTETALLVAAARLGIDPGECEEAYPEVAQIPFEPEQKYSASFRRHADEYVVFVKGAPERILSMCDVTVGGAALDRERVWGEVHRMAAQGLRVLAFAMGRHGAGHDPEALAQDDPQGLVFLGLQGMLDPPRDGVRGAIEGCPRAGQRVVMITGDHAVTAVSIARDLGIVGEGDEGVLTGAELEELTDEELRRLVGEISVYARTSPTHKLRIVEAARAAGHVVAVTGDGVNDALALRAADIGVAMGRDGTDVAREAADMVLADDNFVSIHAAVEGGRVTFDNVRKVTFFLLSTGVGTFVVIPIAMLLGWPLIMFPAQLLWLNLVTKGLQDLALAFEPGEPDVLEHPPRARREPLITRLLWWRTLLVGATMALGALVMFDWALARDDLSLDQARTVALTTLVVFQAFHLGSSRSDRRSVFSVPLTSNRFLLLAQVGALGVHIGALYLPFMQLVLRVEPIGIGAWWRLILVAASVLVVVEVDKLVRRRAARRVAAVPARA
jgi:magnesium-transporting ATPase (P-type)